MIESFENYQDIMQVCTLPLRITLQYSSIHDLPFQSHSNPAKYPRIQFRFESDIYSFLYLVIVFSQPFYFIGIRLFWIFDDEVVSLFVF